MGKCARPARGKQGVSAEAGGNSLCVEVVEASPRRPRARRPGGAGGRGRGSCLQARGSFLGSRLFRLRGASLVPGAVWLPERASRAGRQRVHLGAPRAGRCLLALTNRRARRGRPVPALGAERLWRRWDGEGPLPPAPRGLGIRHSRVYFRVWEAKGALSPPRYCHRLGKWSPGERKCSHC